MTRWTVVVVLYCALATPSYAQETPAEQGSAAPEAEAAQPAPEPAPPPEPAPVAPPAATPVAEPAVVVEAGFPQAYGARPLQLPAQAIEGQVDLHYARSDFLDVWSSAVQGRYSLGQLELGAGVGIFIADNAEDMMLMIERERLTSVFVSLGYAIDPNLMLRGAFAIGTPTDDAQSFVPSLAVINRRHLTAGSTIDLTASAAINHYTGFELPGAEIPSSTSLIVGGEAAMIAQAAPSFAIEGTARIGVVRSFEEESMFNPLPQTRVVYTYGVRGIFSASPMFDVAFGLTIYSAESETLTLSLIGRRLP